MAENSPSTPIEDYGLIADTHSGGLVSTSGSIDWLCLPRFDSRACFAALLDAVNGGHWRIAPKVDVYKTKAAYAGDTMVLETKFVTDTGAVKVTDCLALEHATEPIEPNLIQPTEAVVRVVEGLEGSVVMRMEFSPRFDYGYVRPWIRRKDSGFEAIGGPDALDLVADVELHLSNGQVGAEFEVGAGERLRFIATYHPSQVRVTPHHPDEASQLIDQTRRFWQSWADRCNYRGRYRQEVLRSLLVLKSLIYSPSGGVVAAPTTSLPEEIGGVRNWDYRYCWLRDATFTLDALLQHEYLTEAKGWAGWLLIAVAGDPEDFQIMYGVNGERRLLEQELGWLSGYEQSRPVRTGNAAVDQFQLDVYGEVMDMFHAARQTGVELPAEAWELQIQVADFVCRNWTKPDEGIWEVRSGTEHFVHSKVMAWVALDRAVRAVEEAGRFGPVDRWKQVRGEIRSEVFSRGYNSKVGHFVRAYGDTALDANLLMLPLVGFIEADDPRMVRTIEAIQRELGADGLLLRYRTDRNADGLPGGEGAFLMCSFWLVDCLALIGKTAEAEELFVRLLDTRNRLGLFSEQYDPVEGRMLGNFPQAFSHVALINSAMALEQSGRRWQQESASGVSGQ